MLQVRWHLLALGTALLFVSAGFLADVTAHVDGCHRWHSCPSDDGSYVCGDLGHCSECADNQFCRGGQSRNAAPTATRQPRATRTPGATNTPRPTRTPVPTQVRARPASTAVESRTQSSARDGRDGRDGSDEGASESSPGVGPFGQTGQALAAVAPASRSGGGPSSAEAPAGERPPWSVVVAEWNGVRVLGPLQWLFEGDRVVVRSAVLNTTDAGQTVVLTIQVADGAGVATEIAPFLVADLLPGERRLLGQYLPAGATPPANLQARLEALLPEPPRPVEGP